MTHLHQEVYAVRTLAIFIIMHFVPLLEYKNAWSRSFHLYSCFAQENGSLQTSYIKLFGRLTKISLFCFSPHILTTLFSKSTRRKLRTVFNQIMEWYLKKTTSRLPQKESKQVAEQSMKSSSGQVLKIGQSIFFADILYLLPQTTCCLREQ